DVFRATVEVTKAENRVAAEDRTLALVQKELALLTGRAPDQPLRAVSSSLVVAGPGMDEQAARTVALDARPDLKAAMAAVEAAQAEVDLVRAERFLPEMKVGVKYEEANDFDS